MQLQLTWTDPNTGNHREPLLETPVAIGQEFSQMPATINGMRVSRIVIQDALIADYHALIVWQNQELVIIAQNSISPIKINGTQLTQASLHNGDRIEIGNCEILVKLITTTTGCDRMVGFLFKRRCGRTDNTNCPDCNQSYDHDYDYYPSYGSYRSSYWDRSYNYQSYNRNVDFTEADGVSLENESDADFESDMGAS